MKVVICGAGQVGSSIAGYLSNEANEVTVIDQSTHLADKISERLDVKTVVGHASHPDVLKQAGAENADLLIAVTRSDEVNMVACQAAHSLFNVPTKIARIRDQSYIDPAYADLFSRNNLPIDTIISPEQEVAKAIMRRLEIHGAFDMFSFSDGLVSLVGVLCREDCPVIRTPIRQLTSLFPDLSICVVLIVRNNEPFVPDAEEQMLPGDEVYFVVDRKHLVRCMDAFGYKNQEARRIVIIGGGNIGFFLGQEIEKRHTRISLHIIEPDPERAEYIAGELTKATVLQGSGLDPEILEESNITAAEAVAIVTNHDEINALGALLARRYGVEQNIVLLSGEAYVPLVTGFGIDTVVNPRAITVSSILEHVRRGRILSVYSLREGFAEIIEVLALETSPWANKSIEQIDFPKDVIVGAIVRDEQVIIPKPDTVIKPDDRVIILATQENIKEIEKMFSVRLEFF